MPNELILVVDDEPDILKLCDRILSTKGYNVYTASSGTRAIEIARETPLDVVLLDIKMPDGDGITIFSKIKRYQPEVAGIVITGYPSMEAAIEALRHDISSFVLKPFTPGELRQAVADALDRRQLERDYARLQTLIPLYDLSRSLMTTVDIDALLDQVVDIALQETEADRVSLMLEHAGKLSIKAARGLPEDIQIKKTETPIGEGIAGWVAKHGEPLLLNPDVAMPPALDDALTRDEIASAVCVPLALKDRVIGVLNLTKLESTERPFTPSQRDLLTVLASQIAIAIENARLFHRQQTLTHELAQANANLRGLQQAATAITSRLSPERVLQTILDGCAGVMENATISLGLLDPDSKSIEVHLHHGDSQTRQTTTHQLEARHVEMIEVRNKTTEVLEEQLHPLLMDAMEPTSVGEPTFVDIIPLSVQGQVLGAMAVGARQELSETDIMALRTFADQAAVSIANARLFSDLQEGYEESRELNRLKNEFIGISTDRLNTSLSLINTHAQRFSESIPEDLQAELEELRDAANALERQINGLSELSNLEPGGRALRREPVAIEEVITTIVNRVSPLIEAREQDFRIELAADLPAVEADRTKLEIVVSDLILHAAKSTQAHGELGIRADATKDEVHISVWDTAPAIPVEDQTDIFDTPLAAVDSVLQRTRSSGPALPIVRRLVERHGGYITLDSEPGTGNTFKLALPLSPAPEG